MTEDLLDAIRRASSSHKALQAMADQSRVQRDRLVCEAVAAGLTGAVIAEAAGFARTRVAQIAKRGKS